MLNANTLDDFKERDKAALLQGVARAIWDDVASGAALAQPERLLRFLLLLSSASATFSATGGVSAPDLTVNLECRLSPPLI